MRFINVTSLIVLFLVFPFVASPQTCRVKIADAKAGAPVYKEVYEFDYVDVKPEFPGGRNSMVNFINATRQYPHEAYESGIEGRILCSFIVNTDGHISNINILRGVESSLNNEAMRIISRMPEWTPGRIGDAVVPVRVVCCIPFRK